MTVLHRSAGDNDGAYPNGGLAMDCTGVLYGTTSGGGKDGLGTVFKLTPTDHGWEESVIQTFRQLDGSNYFWWMPTNGGTDLWHWRNAVWHDRRRRQIWRGCRLFADAICQRRVVRTGALSFQARSWRWPGPEQSARCRGIRRTLRHDQIRGRQARYERFWHGLQIGPYTDRLA